MSTYITFCDGGAKGASPKGNKSQKFSGWSFQIYKFDPSADGQIANPEFITQTNQGFVWDSNSVVDASLFKLIKSEFGWCCNSEASRMEYAALLYAVKSLRSLPQNPANKFFIVCDRDNIPKKWLPKMCGGEIPLVFTKNKGYPESAKLKEWVCANQPKGVWISASAKCIFNQHVDLMATLGCFLANQGGRNQNSSGFGETYRFKVPHPSNVSVLTFNSRAEHENPN
jgi:hypothetical protein